MILVHLLKLLDVALLHYSSLTILTVSAGLECDSTLLVRINVLFLISSGVRSSALPLPFAERPLWLLLVLF